MTFCQLCNRKIDRSANSVPCSKCQRLSHKECFLKYCKLAKEETFVCEICTGAFSRTSGVPRSPPKAFDKMNEEGLGAVLANIKKLETKMEEYSHVILELDRKVTRSEEKLDVLLNLESRIVKLEQASSDLEVINEKFNSRFTELNERCRELQNRTDDLERFSRIRNLVIRGIPQQEHENLKEIIKKASEVLGCSEVQINEVHRMNHQKANSNVLVVFRTHEDKNSFFRARLKKILYADQIVPTSSINKGDTRRSVGVYDHLSKNSQLLFQKAKENADKLGYSQCFTNKGIIYYRTAKGTPKIAIRNQQQLDDLILAAQ